MPERWPPWIKEIADLESAANLITYKADGGHRYRWESHGQTSYPVVGGERLALTRHSPWTMTVRPVRGAEPYHLLRLSVDVQENPDDPDEWVVAPTVFVRWLDANLEDVPAALAGSISFKDFVPLVRPILSKRMTPWEAWAVIEPKLLLQGPG